jgi:hypothetical protein
VKRRGSDCSCRPRRTPRNSTSDDRTSLRLVLPCHVLDLYPGYFLGYVRVLHNLGLIIGCGADPSTGIAIGATLEVLLIVANVATARDVPGPQARARWEILVTSRPVSRGDVHAIGIIGTLAFLLMRQSAAAASTPVLGGGVRGGLLRSVPDQTWLLCGSHERSRSGCLMYRFELVPRGMPWLRSHRRSACHRHGDFW